MPDIATPQPRRPRAGAVRFPLFLLAASAAFANAQPAPPTLPQDGQNRVVQTWAKPGMLRNPVAICLDPKGNIYVAESDRAGNAVQDTRNLGHLNAVEEDLKFRSVADRLAQINRWTQTGAFAPDYFTKTEDRVRVVSDTDGDGVADSSRVFAGGFNEPLDGIGSGVMWLDGNLYYTCIPHLWILPDADANLEADSRRALSSGYGVRWCFYGHDLHGLTMGPDGRVYFSMGDRGYNITTPEGRHFVGVDRGGVFRCWPDGSGLELYYQGLRNPQDLCFNDLGDLFTGDNNCDSGDQARAVAIYEGGDSGWRQDVQSLESRGPWNREAMWKTLKDVSGPARPAWSLPPLAYMGAGPSGIEFYPGFGESPAYEQCFFFVDFYGSGSTIHTFRCISEGAGFRVADHAEYFKGATVTDIKWGYDGRLYMSDWGGGWSPNDNGNIVTLTNTNAHAVQAAAIKDVRDLFAAGFAGRDAATLARDLRHRDQRVRQAAQHELARRGPASLEVLQSLAGDASAADVPRAHAIWAIGQIARSSPGGAGGLVPLLRDPSAEVRTQAVRTAGDLKTDASPGLRDIFVEMLKDPAPRVRAAAATALGKIGDVTAVAPLLQALADNDNSDLVVRHAASYALSRIGAADEVATRAEGMNAAARLGAVIALRRMEDQRAEAVVPFLSDPDHAVAIEAARAIYDLRLPRGLPLLAGLLETSLPAERATEPLLRRAIEANMLLATDACAARLAAFAAHADAAPEWRLLALQRLDEWDKELKREGVWGNWIGMPPRSVEALRRAVRTHIGDVLRAASGHEALAAAARTLQLKHALDLSPAQMLAFVADPANSDADRVAVLDQIVAGTPGQAETAAVRILDGPSTGLLRKRAHLALAATNPAAAVEKLTVDAANGAVADRQAAVSVLASIPTDAAHRAVASLVDSLRFGALDKRLALEVAEGAASLPPEDPARKVADELATEGTRPRGYATRLLAEGGDPHAGRSIFLHHPSAQCVRCHTVEGVGGAAGPNLSYAAARLPAPKLVQSVVEPNAEIAVGYGKVSAMPVMTEFLSPREVRDVVAYLRTLGADETHEAAPATEARRTSTSRPVAIMLLALLTVFIVRGRKTAE